MQRACHEVVEAGLGGLCMRVEKDAGVSDLGGEAVCRGGLGTGVCVGWWRGCFLRRGGIVDRFAEVLRTLARHSS